ncbi:MAG: DNA repair protein RecO [bacterium]
MPRFQESAFVLRKWDFGESDQVVSLLTRGKGRLRGIAKGAKRSKKRFGGLLSPFMMIQVECFEKQTGELVRVEGCTLLRYFSRIQEDLPKLLMGCTVLEVMDRLLPEGETGHGFFQLAEESFSYLEAEEEGLGSFPTKFFLKVVALLGLEPQFGNCVHCRRRIAPAGLFGFSVPQGGAVCGSCIRRGTATHRVSAQTLSMLRKWLWAPLSEPSGCDCLPSAVGEAEAILSAFISFHAGRDLRSLQVLRKIFAAQAGLNRKDV